VLPISECGPLRRYVVGQFEFFSMLCSRSAELAAGGKSANWIEVS